MRELSLNILDIAQNAVCADATLVEIDILEDTEKGEMLIQISDNGRGMTPAQAKEASDPFYTTRTTRKVGMGIPLFKMAAEITGGSLSILSKMNAGTKITALFKTQSVDFPPLGDMGSTVAMLIAMNIQIDFKYRHVVDTKEFVLHTPELKQILGDVPLSDPAVFEWIKEYISEQTLAINSKGSIPLVTDDKKNAGDTPAPHNSNERND